MIIIDRPTCGLEAGASVVTACGWCTRIDPTVIGDGANMIGLLLAFLPSATDVGAARLMTHGRRRIRDGGARPT